MANLAVVSSVAPVFPTQARTRNHLCAVAILAGQSVYSVGATGGADLCQANSGGKEQFRGIALEKGYPGRAISVIEEGEVAGFDLSALDVGALVYQGDTPGVLSSTASATKTVPVGKVHILTNGIKVLYVRANENGSF